MDPTLHFFLEAGGPGAVMCLGWWLSGRFRNIEKAYSASLAAHELKDQTRHEENLERFGTIGAELAGLNARSRNGDARHRGLPNT